MPEVVVLLSFLYLIAIAIPLAWIDLRQHRLPNSLTLSAIGIAAICLALAGFISGDWVRPLLSIAVGTITFFVGYQLAKREAIGMGDVKLLTSLNAIAFYFSPILPLVFMTLGFVIASAVSIVRVRLKKITFKSAIPLGPYLLIGFFATVSPSAVIATAAVWS